MRAVFDSTKRALFASRVRTVLVIGFAITVVAAVIAAIVFAVLALYVNQSKAEFPCGTRANRPFEGDRGGPLMVKRGDWFQAGVASVNSFGLGVFTRVDRHGHG